MSRTDAEQLELETCKPSPDGTHCYHWWDATGPCCFCKDDTDTGEGKLSDE